MKETRKRSLKKLVITNGVLVLFMMISLYTSAQEECGLEVLYSSESWVKKDSLRNVKLYSVLQNMKLQEQSPSLSVYVIPVVFHIFHLGESAGIESNIPEATITESLQELNDRFNDGDGPGANVEFEFCLATRDNDGCPTDGIIRVDGTVIEDYEEYGIGIGTSCPTADSWALRDLSRWSPENYLNIWVVHNLCGAGAYTSNSPGTDYDGIVMERHNLYEGSTTLTHEVGHWFDLEHTFSGGVNSLSCAPNEFCESQGDFVCDTAPHIRTNCGDNNSCEPNTPYTDWKRNYMSYCSLKDRFTVGQKARMHASMQIWPRNLLIDSPGCLPLEPLDISIENVDGTLVTNSTGESYQWLTCFEGEFTPIPEATDSTYAYDQQGDFSLEITTSTGCVFSSECFAVVSTTSLNEISMESGVTFFPNPATNSLNIQLGCSVEVLEVQIYNVHGKLVHFHKDFHMDNSSMSFDLNSGIYTITIFANEIQKQKSVLIID